MTRDKTNDTTLISTIGVRPCQWDFQLTSTSNVFFLPANDCALTIYLQTLTKLSSLEVQLRLSRAIMLTSLPPVIRALIYSD